MKIVRNSDYYQSKEQYNVKCSKYNKDATITFFIVLCKCVKLIFNLLP